MRINKSSLLILFSTLMTITSINLFLNNTAKAYGLFSSGMEGKPLPSINLPSLYDSKKRLTRTTIVGHHPALLNVWASWCHYCQLEHGMLMKIKNQYHVPIYSIDYKDDPQDAKGWIAQAGNPFTMTGVDEEGVVESSLDISGTPATFVIDKHGYIRYEYVGGITEGLWAYTIWPIVQKLENEK